MMSGILNRRGFSGFAGTRSAIVFPALVIHRLALRNPRGHARKSVSQISDVGCFHRETKLCRTFSDVNHVQGSSNKPCLIGPFRLRPGCCETYVNKPKKFAQLRLLSTTKPRNFDQRTPLEVRPNRGALKAFLCGAS